MTCPHPCPDCGGELRYQTEHGDVHCAGCGADYTHVAGPGPNRAGHLLDLDGSVVAT